MSRSCPRCCLQPAAHPARLPSHHVLVCFWPYFVWIECSWALQRNPRKSHQKRIPRPRHSCYRCRPRRSLDRWQEGGSSRELGQVGNRGCQGDCEAECRLKVRTLLHISRAQYLLNVDFTCVTSQRGGAVVSVHAFYQKLSRHSPTNQGGQH